MLFIISDNSKIIIMKIQYFYSCTHNMKFYFSKLLALKTGKNIGFYL